MLRNEFKVPTYFQIQKESYYESYYMHFLLPQLLTAIYKSAVNF